MQEEALAASYFGREAREALCSQKDKEAREVSCSKKEALEALRSEKEALEPKDAALGKAGVCRDLLASAHGLLSAEDTSKRGRVVSWLLTRVLVLVCPYCGTFPELVHVRLLALTLPQAILLAVVAKAEAAGALSPLPVGHGVELAVPIQSPLLLAPVLQ